MSEDKAEMLNEIIDVLQHMIHFDKGRPLSAWLMASVVNVSLIFYESGASLEEYQKFMDDNIELAKLLWNQDKKPESK